MEAMQNADDIAELVGRMPDADEPGKESKFTGPESTEADKVFASILAGGRDSILALVSLVKDAGDPTYKDFRPQYVLHGLALMAGKPGNDAMRKLFAEAVGEALLAKGLSIEVQLMLVRELQAAGGKESVPALARLLGDENLALAAAMALEAIGAPAAEELRKALPRAQGRRRTGIVQALGHLRDVAAAPMLREIAADQHDADARMAATWALAAIGDSDAAGVILRGMGAEDPWERSRTLKAVFLLGENLEAAGKKDLVKRLYLELLATAKDPKDGYIREAIQQRMKAIGV